jgi:DNA-binding HxlR family transcriptional regulator
MQVIGWRMLNVMIKSRSHCPIAFGLELFGDKWSLLILRDIIFKGKRNYTQFLDAEEKISTNILATRLIQLEETGLIEKFTDETNRKKIVYVPTKKGLDLLPVMLEIIRWSAKYDSDTAAPRAFVRKLLEDREVLLEELRKPFRGTK